MLFLLQTRPTPSALLVLPSCTPAAFSVVIAWSWAETLLSAMGWPVTDSPFLWGFHLSDRHASQEGTRFVPDILSAVFSKTFLPAYNQPVFWPMAMD